MGDTRLFVALPLGGEALSHMTELLRKAPAGPEVKWSKAGQLHLTLLFLGATPEGKVPSLVDGLQALAARHGTFGLSIDGWGTFPNRDNPRVLFAQVGGEMAPLKTLALEVRKTLGPAGDSGSSSFQAHVTLGRVREGRDADIALRFLEKEKKLLEGSFRADTVVLFESVLEPQGARYVPRASFSFPG